MESPIWPSCNSHRRPSSHGPQPLGHLPKDPTRDVPLGRTASRNARTPRCHRRHVDPTIQGRRLPEHGAVQRDLRRRGRAKQTDLRQQLQHRSNAKVDDLPRLGCLRDQTVRHGFQWGTSRASKERKDDRRVLHDALPRSTIRADLPHRPPQHLHL